MKKLIFSVVMVTMLCLSGCAGVTAQIAFTKTETSSNALVSGKLRGRFYDVQKFRSLLESLEYRVSEKAK